MIHQQKDFLKKKWITYHLTFFSQETERFNIILLHYRYTENT